MGIGAYAGFVIGPSVPFGVNEFSVLHDRQGSSLDGPSLHKALDVFVEGGGFLVFAQFIGEPFVDGNIGFVCLVRIRRVAGAAGIPCNEKARDEQGDRDRNEDLFERGALLHLAKII